MITPQSSVCIFCDDIREEVGGKLSFMGVYGADMAFPVPPPIALLKMAAIAWLIVEKEHVPTQLIIRVMLQPEGREIIKFEAARPEGIDHPEWSEKAVIRSHIIFPPIHFSGNCF